MPAATQLTSLPSQLTSVQIQLSRIEIQLSRIQIQLTPPFCSSVLTFSILIVAQTS